MSTADASSASTDTVTGSFNGKTLLGLLGRLTHAETRRSHSFSLVSFHAHPDDEALLTGGTIARASAEGHRVAIVCATDGALGLVSSEVAGLGDLGARRRKELLAAAAALGCGDVRFLGYADSGYEAPRDGNGGARRGQTAGGARSGNRFCDVPTREAAEKLAEILREVEADVITVYDPAGGYGHPDHLAVHRVGVAAAELAGTPVVLEATVDRRVLRRALRALGALGVTRALKVEGAEWDAGRFDNAFADPERITHRVRVGRHASAKRNAMAAHASQATGGETVRTLAVFARLPRLVFRLVFAYEWFVEVQVPAPRQSGAAARAAGRPDRNRTRTGRCDDIFASLRAPAARAAPHARAAPAAEESQRDSTALGQ